MLELQELLDRGCPAAHHAPWPRAVVGPSAWHEAGAELAALRWTLFGLWAEPARIHMAVQEVATGRFAVLSLDCPDGGFPSIGAMHPPAQRLERAAFDLFGLRPEAAPDTRPWLDHGVWGVCQPMGAATPTESAERRYAFLPTTGEGLHQIPVGPVHAGIIEPGHFRFTANGETVVRLEERLGYVHKGIESLMAGAGLDEAARLAGRVSGDSTVAYALAFARAAEAALGVEAPPRAHYLRALMAELERLANHLGDFGAICNDASFSMMHAHCGILRERILRAAATSFGHRLMRDCIVPGGVAVDLLPEGVKAIRDVLDELGQRFPALVDLYDNTASLQDRTVTTGILTKTLAERFAPGGFVGRASGRSFDARRTPGYPPYEELQFAVPVLEAGDVDARVWIRIREIEQSMALITQILERLPPGPLRVELGSRSEAAEGVALVEGFRGDILLWLRLGADGKVERCHPRDPSWFQWPLLEAVIEGNIVADFPLCNKSFNCSYSGHDL